MEILARLPLFRGLTSDERHYILSMPKHFVSFRPKKRLIVEGSHEPFFYVLLSGEAQVFQHQQFVGTVTGGEFIGEMGFICNEPRSATVIATETVVALKLDKESFRMLPARIRELIKDQIIAGLVNRINVQNKVNLSLREQLQRQ
ncbi:cyclic nucleotide-binding domain-containing protein [Saliniradius amylolyticus]|nr:cyclic nucleotide-binding domain-containing protein [Saliniradius amylolyticus]